MASNGNIVMGMGLGAVGAAIGAAVWAGVAYGTGYEIGWIAWGIGGLVGILAVAGGARGAAGGSGAAALAAGAIIVGKLVASQFAVNAYLTQTQEDPEMRALYNELMYDAQNFQNVMELDYPKFMVEHNYTEATTPEQVPQEDLEVFKSESAPMLRTMFVEQPTYEQWLDKEMGAFRDAINQNLTMSDRLNLGLMDIIFFLLGVATAFSIVTKQEA